MSNFSFPYVNESYYPVVNTLYYKANDSSKENLELKNILMSFEDFNENTNFKLVTLCVNIINIYSHDKSMIVGFPGREHCGLRFIHLKDFMPLLYFMIKYNKMVKNISINIDANEGTPEKIFINKTVEYFDYKFEELASNRGFGKINNAQSNLQFIPDKTIKLFEWIGNKIANLYDAILPNTIAKYSKTITNSIGWVIFIPLNIILLPVDIILGAIGLFQDLSYKNTVNNKVLQAGIELENTLIYKQFLGTADLKDDLIAYNYLNHSNIFPQDINFEISKNLSGIEEANIMKQIFENTQDTNKGKKDFQKGLEELKQKRIEKTFNKRNEKQSSELGK